MTTELIIDHIRNNWWILLFIICMTSYYIYSYIRDRVELKKIKDRKKELEGELVGLEAKYSEQAKKLEEKYEEKKKFFSSGGGPAFGGKKGRK
jgi:fructoselysine-6-P-deglycase FrlB-like protein